MKRSVLDALTVHLRGLTDPPRVLELGIGTGELLVELTRLHPQARWVAVDVNPALIQFARDRLHHTAVDFVQQDLREAPWSDQIGSGFDGVYSLQSFHDLGGRDTLRSVYAQIASALAPGGLLLNADFIVPMPHDDPDNPRRFSIEEHTELLRDSGFDDIRTVAVSGMLGCIAATLR